jgi:hypothetical protein
MNPQPDPIIGQFFAFVFIIGIIIYTYKAYLEGKSININQLDNFVIGYIEESPVQTHIIEKHYKTSKEVQPVRIIEKKTERVRTERVIETKPSFESQQLYVDCIDALIALGMKKGEAKRKAKFVFSNMDPQPSTIQDFLRIALGMPS